jgi:translocation and assembly module TamA
VRRLAILYCLAAGCAGEKAEGRPVIHAVHLQGVKSVKERELKSRLAMQGKSWWPLAKKPYLNPFDVEIDAKRIENYYHQHGYFDIKVTEQKVKPRKKDQVDVFLTVDEGPPTRIDGIELAGLEGVNDRALTAVKKLQIKKGQIFDYNLYLAEKERIAGTLKQRGYAWAEVTGQVDVDRDLNTAQVKLQVKPGPWARFGKLEVQGTQKTSADRLRRIARLPTGKPFNLETLEELRSDVYALGMFASVRVDYVHSPDRPEIADVLLTVREGTFHEVRFGFGLGIESQRNDIHASVQYTKRNFIGGLRTLRLRLMPAYVAIPAVWNLQRQGPAGTTDAQFTQPDLFWRTDLKATLGFDLGIDYAYQYYGPRAALSLGRDFWKHRIHIEVGYNFQLLMFFATDPAILEKPELAGRLYGFVDPYRLGWWQEDLILDLRNKPLDPTRGGYLAVTVEEGGIYAGGAFSYQKIMPDARGYIGNRWVVLAGRIQFGQLFTQGDLGSPITRRFYLGGPGSHRGFNFGRLAPQVASGLPNVPPIPIGGDQMFLAQLELRVNLFRLAGNWVSTAAFADGGDVAAPSCGTAECQQVTGAVPSSVDFSKLHWAVGGGLRYKTLIGTIRLDLGVRLNRLDVLESDGRPNPDPGSRLAFHISIGEAF